MIAYRAEVWCDHRPLCSAGNGKGISHDDHLRLPCLAQNLERMLIKQGWLVTADGKHYCPEHREGRE